MSTSFGILFFVLGLAFGSFLNVCIYRIPLRLLDEPEDLPAWREMVHSLAAWRAVSQPEHSFCPSCRRQIRWRDNIPVLSWLLLGGRCRDCGAHISFGYAAVELLTAVLFLACYARFGLSLAAVKFCLLALLLIALIFTDAAHKLLPDAFTIPGLMLGFAFSFFVPVNDLASALGRAPADHPFSPLLSFTHAILGALAGAGFVYGAGLVYKLVRGQEGMGLGDVKLMAMVGAFLGLPLTLLTIFGASILGSLFALTLFLFVWRKRVRRRVRRGESGAQARRRAWQSAQFVRYYAMPFGVFLGTVALLATFFGNDFIRWYWTQYLNVG